MSLPPELYEDIAWKRLPVKDILALCSVSKSLRRICDDPETWRFLLTRDFGITDFGYIPKKRYKREYRRRQLTQAIRPNIAQYMKDEYDIDITRPHDGMISSFETEKAIRQIANITSDITRVQAHEDMMGRWKQEYFDSVGANTTQDRQRVARTGAYREYLQGKRLDYLTSLVVRDRLNEEFGSIY